MSQTSAINPPQIAKINLRLAGDGSGSAFRTPV
jgi:hypothetical protein